MSHIRIGIGNGIKKRNGTGLGLGLDQDWIKFGIEMGREVKLYKSHFHILEFTDY